jgi:hypothetical protein
VSWSEAPQRGYKRALRAHRLRVVMWVLLVLGLPLAITLKLVFSSADYGAAGGDQPGGEISARLVDRDGNPLAGQPVELQVWPAGGLPETVETRASDAQGRVTFRAPPAQGKYRLLAGGGELQRVGRERSFVDGDGRAVELEEVELVLVPGAVIELTFTRQGEPPTGRASLKLEGETQGGAFFGLAGTPISLTRNFEGGVCVLDGLPPLTGQITAEFADGASVSFKVSVGTGTSRLGYDLPGD